MSDVENNSTIYLWDVLKKIEKKFIQDPLFRFSNLTGYLDAYCKRNILILNAKEHAAYEDQSREAQTLKKNIALYILTPDGGKIFQMLLNVSLAQLKDILVLEHPFCVVNEFWGQYHFSSHGVDSINFLQFCKEDIVSVDIMPDFEPTFKNLEYFTPEGLKKFKEAKSSYQSNNSRLTFSPKKFCGNKPKQFICDLIDECIKDKSNRNQLINENIKE